MIFILSFRILLQEMKPADRITNFTLRYFGRHPKKRIGIYRRPHKYKLSISECIEEPFIRKDSRIYL